MATDTDQGELSLTKLYPEVTPLSVGDRVKMLRGSYIGADPIFAAAERILTLCQSRLQRRGARAVYMLIGGESLGKATLAEQIAAVEFANGKTSPTNRIRINCERYQHPMAVAALFGAPIPMGPMEEGGEPMAVSAALLTDQSLAKYRRQASNGAPVVFVILDNFHSASPAMQTVLGQLLTDGTLTVANNRVTNFQDCVFFLVVDQDQVSKASGMARGGAQDNSQAIQDDMSATFGEAIGGRVDEFIAFDDWSADIVERAVVLELNTLAKSCDALSLGLVWDQPAIDVLVARTVARRSNAINVQRVVKQYVGNAIVAEDVKQEVGKGDVIHIKGEAGELSFYVARGAMAASPVEPQSEAEEDTQVPNPTFDESDYANYSIGFSCPADEVDAQVNTILQLLKTAPMNSVRSIETTKEEAGGLVFVRIVFQAVQADCEAIGPMCPHPMYRVTPRAKQ